MPVKRPTTLTVKRSVTLRNDVDAAIQDAAGIRGYSAFVNEAAIMALQARGVDDWLADVSTRKGPLTAKDEAWARARLRAARAETRP